MKKQKDLIIIDCQLHFLEYEEDKNKTIERFENLIKRNFKNLNEINIVIDVIEWLEEERYNEFLIEEEYARLEENFEEDKTEEELSLIKELSEQLMPYEIIKTIIKAKQEGIKINIIEKNYGYIRDIIDTKPELTTLYTSLIFELDNIGFDSEMIDIETLELLKNYSFKKNELELSKEQASNIKKIKRILNIFLKKGGYQDLYPIVELLNDSIRLSPEIEIEKYNHLTNSQNDLILCGGALCECFLEETNSIINVLSQQQNNRKLIIKEDHCFRFGENTFEDFKDIYIKSLKDLKLIHKEQENKNLRKNIKRNS